MSEQFSDELHVKIFENPDIKIVSCAGMEFPPYTYLADDFHIPPVPGISQINLETGHGFSQFRIGHWLMFKYHEIEPDWFIFNVIGKLNTIIEDGKILFESVYTVDSLSVKLDRILVAKKGTMIINFGNGE